MRIIAGNFKGFRIPVLRTRGGIRPTTDRVREALFNVLGGMVEGSRILDLFAGTGAFGLEALSRGAEFAVFTDRDRKVVVALSDIVRKLNLEDRVRILGIPADAAVARLSAEREEFRIIYLDPPYATDYMRQILSDPLLPTLLEKDGLVVAERDVHTADPGSEMRWSRIFSRKYGGTLLEIFRQ